MAVRDDPNAVTIMPVVQTSTLPMLRCDSRCDLSEMTARLGRTVLTDLDGVTSGAQKVVPKKPRGLDNGVKRLNGTQG